MPTPIRVVLALAAFALLAGASPKPFRPVPPTAVAADSLIRDGEGHFAHLWQLTFGGQNAEAYWSADGTKFIWQWTRDEGSCDQQYVMDLRTGARTLVSTGKGRTTCGYFYDRDRRVLFASTHATADTCPAPPDMSHGYTWAIYPSYELWTATPDGRDLKRLTQHDGYDAEGTINPKTKRMLYTSEKSGDLEVWTMKEDGSGKKQISKAEGYDGGAVFSHDGKMMVWRAYRPDTPEKVATYRDLLKDHLTAPMKMEIHVANADGSGEKTITNFGCASFAPTFTPDGKRILFSSNKHACDTRKFELYIINIDGGPEFGGGNERVHGRDRVDFAACG